MSSQKITYISTDDAGCVALLDATNNTEAKKLHAKEVARIYKDEAENETIYFCEFGCVLYAVPAEMISDDVEGDAQGGHVRQVVKNYDDTDMDKYEIARISCLHPPEPECEDGKHDWEETSLQFSGHGIKYTDKCKKCGLEEFVDEGHTNDNGMPADYVRYTEQEDDEEYDGWVSDDSEEEKEVA